MSTAKRVRVDDSNGENDMPDVKLALRILRSLPYKAQGKMLNELSIENRKEMIRMLFVK